METSQTQQPYVTLNNGFKMPQIGLGAGIFDLQPEELYKLVVSAIIDYGYRSIDTASLYGNEEIIGNALKECFDKGIKREDLYITTKIWNDEKDDVEGALRKSLKKLQLDYVDLYLVHYPLPMMDWKDTENPIKQTPMYKVWGEMERLCEEGLCKSIGVSNYTLPMLLDIMTYAKIRPVINQIEIHPYLVQKEFVDFHAKLKVRVEAFAPLAAINFHLKTDKSQNLNLMTEPVIIDVGAKYGKSPAQIVLNWHLHRGHIIIPKTSKISRLSENLNCYDFKLTEEEYNAISKLDINGRIYDPITWDDFIGFIKMPYYS